MTQAEISNVRSKIKGKRVEDISRHTLAKVVAEAGHQASQKALNAGRAITKFQDGQLIKVYADGHQERVQLS